ncbi:phage shock protein C (PspC) family protein [Chryseobacterium sp. RU33C]|nr:phage shock protein C (PspC) family protein [Chryseobacterium sp. RU33C]
MYQKSLTLSNKFKLLNNNLKMLSNIRHKMEREWFGVLTRMGAKLGIPVSKLRIFFIYSTFATAGFFFLIYLGLAFTLWIKDIFITRRPSVFDL